MTLRNPTCHPASSTGIEPDRGLALSGNGNSESTTAILADTMPLIELSVTEVRYLAKMNGESILVMHTIGKKNNTVLPELRVAEEIQAKFAAVLPSGLPDPFAELRAAQSRKAQRGKASSRTGAKRK